MNERIRKLRKKLDLTQRKFAEKIGVKQNTVAQYEMGRNIPIDSVISLICREFNVSEDWLRNGVGEMFVEQTRDEQIAGFIGDMLKDEGESFRRRLISALAGLKESDWEVLEKLVDSMQKG